MNFLKGLLVIVLLGCIINMFRAEKTGSVDGQNREFCKDKKCVNCSAYIGCYGYEWSSNAGLVIGPDNTLNYCKKCAENRN